MELAAVKQKRRPGRPSNGEVLVGFKLAPLLAEKIRLRARQTGRQQSELVEESGQNLAAAMLTLCFFALRD
jgi:hypothetical protein